MDFVGPIYRFLKMSLTLCIGVNLTKKNYDSMRVVTLWKITYGVIPDSSKKHRFRLRS